MKDYEKSRKNYEQRKKSGDYDANMEYNKENDVESGAWVLITRQVPVEEKCKPHLFGIYWGIPKQDSYQVIFLDKIERCSFNGRFSHGEHTSKIQRKDGIRKDSGLKCYRQNQGIFQF